MTVISFLRAARPAAPRSSSPRLSFGLAALVAASAGSVASASVVIDSGDPFDPDDDLLLDVRGVVGDGIFSSYLVVDFAATGGDTYAWEWRWDPGDDARGATLLFSILDGTDLAARIGGEDGQGFGIFVENFELASESEAGEPADFWSYWVAEADDIDPGVAWTSSSVGASFRDLSNGSIDGWYNGFDGTEPRVPVTPVPAPGALGLIALAIGTAGRRRRGC